MTGYQYETPEECPEHATYVEKWWVWRRVLPRRIEVLRCRHCPLAVALESP